VCLRELHTAATTAARYHHMITMNSIFDGNYLKRRITPRNKWRCQYTLSTSQCILYKSECGN